MISKLLENLLNKKTHTKGEIEELRDTIVTQFQKTVGYTFVFSTFLGVLIDYYIFR
jgi:hypothetical protein